MATLDQSDQAAGKAFKSSIKAVAQSSGPRRYDLPYPTPATLKDVSGAALAASLAFESADTAPTTAQIEACTEARQQAKAVMARWDELKGRGLAAFNAKVKNQGHAVLALPPLRLPSPLPSDENGNRMKQEQ
jgi:hypothetical protein